MSGSSCAAIGCRTSSSTPTTRSSTPPATPGATSKPTQKESHQSACECGRMSVTAHDSWYNVLLSPQGLDFLGFSCPNRAFSTAYADPPGAFSFAPLLAFSP